MFGDRDQTFRGTPSSSVKARKNVQEERKNITYVQAGSVSGVRMEWEKREWVLVGGSGSGFYFRL